MAQANRKTFFLLLAPSAVLLAFFILPLGVAVITSFSFRILRFAITSV